MAQLTQQSLDVLLALLRAVRAQRMGQRSELTVDAVELNGMLGGPARAPYRNKAACTEAVVWCKEHAYPLIPMLIVIDANYRHPESTLLNAAYGVQSRATATALWEAEVDSIATCDLAVFSQMTSALEAEAQKLLPPEKPKRATSSASPAQRQRKAGSARSGSQTQSVSAYGADARRNNSVTAANRKTSGREPSRTGQAASKQPTRTTSNTRTRVHVQEVDTARFEQVFVLLEARACEEFGQQAEDLEAFFALLEEPVLTAWERWRNDLAIETWSEDDAGTGAIVAALQKTVDDPDAFWIDRESGVGSIARKLRRGLGREDGTRSFELAVIRFFKGDLAAADFLEAMKEHLARQYTLVAHLLFLYDSTSYVPVDSMPLERGLKDLGVEFSLSGNCTWANYSRFLSYLDRTVELCARHELAISRLSATYVLRFAGTGTLNGEGR